MLVADVLGDVVALGDVPPWLLAQLLVTTHGETLPAGYQVFARSRCRRRCQADAGAADDDAGLADQHRVQLGLGQLGDGVGQRGEAQDDVAQRGGVVGAVVQGGAQGGRAVDELLGVDVGQRREAEDGVPGDRTGPAEAAARRDADDRAELRVVDRADQDGDRVGLVERRLARWPSSRPAARSSATVSSPPSQPSPAPATTACAAAASKPSSSGSWPSRRPSQARRSAAIASARTAASGKR